MTDTLKLKSVLVAKGIKASDLADLIGMSSTSLSYKMNNKAQFVVAEVKAIQRALDLSDQQRDEIFFAQ